MRDVESDLRELAAERRALAMTCHFCTKQIEDGDDWALLLNKRPAHAKCLPRESIRESVNPYDPDSIQSRIDAERAQP